MIAKAKSISHGINDISYITGESRNKKHPERIFHVKDNLLPPGLDATGIWDSMRLTLDKFKKVKNSVIRIEVSPAPEHTKDFTIADWENCGTTSSESSTTSSCMTRTAGRIPRKPTSRAARARCGFIWNPRAVFPTFTARSAASTSRGASTTTMTSTCVRSVPPSVWP